MPTVQQWLHWGTGADTCLGQWQFKWHGNGTLWHAEFDNPGTPNHTWCLCCLHSLLLCTWTSYKSAVETPKRQTQSEKVSSLDYCPVQGCCVMFSDTDKYNLGTVFCRCIFLFVALYIVSSNTFSFKILKFTHIINGWLYIHGVLLKFFFFLLYHNLSISVYVL